jgi:hypothetical protein
MFKSDIRTPEQALAYLTDCTLATVSDLAMKKSRPKLEFERQKAMAQTSLDWMVSMKVETRGTRAEKVLREHGGSVDAWAATFFPAS